MATISYGFGGTNVILANGVTNGAQWAPAFASNPAGTRHVAVWTSNAAGTDVVGRLFAGINPRSDEFAVSPPAPFFQNEASIAGLADGRFPLRARCLPEFDGIECEGCSGGLGHGPSPVGSTRLASWRPT